MVLKLAVEVKALELRKNEPIGPWEAAANYKRDESHNKNGQSMSGHWSFAKRTHWIQMVILKKRSQVSPDLPNLR